MELQTSFHTAVIQIRPGVLFGEFHCKKNKNLGGIFLNKKIQPLLGHIIPKLYIARMSVDFVRVFSYPLFFMGYIQLMTHCLYTSNAKLTACPENSNPGHRWITSLSVLNYISSDSSPLLKTTTQNNSHFLQLFHTGRARLIRSHSSARFCFELSGNSN